MGDAILEVLSVSVLGEHLTLAPRPDSKDKEVTLRPIVESGTMRIEQGRVYTLEGANQSGKSTLIGAILGAYAVNRPPSKTRRSWLPLGRASALRVEISLKIDGKLVQKQSIPRSLRTGIVGIFQDDTLIPTMTIEEQFLLRHAARGISALNLHLRQMSRSQLDNTPLPERVSRGNFIDRIFPLPTGERDEDDVRAEATQLLRAFSTTDTDFTDILDRKPHELSGGAVAVARIVQALLTKNLRVLFLDEVFRGVQKEVWPRIVRALRRNAMDRKIAIVAVTHVVDEIVEWRPHSRFAIEEQQLRKKDAHPYFLVAKGINIEPRLFPIFEIEEQMFGASDKAWPWTPYFVGPAVLFFDENVASHPLLEALRGDFRARGMNVIEIPVTAKEADKNFQRLQAVINEIFTRLDVPVRSVFIVGGGIVLNFAGFVASILNRGQLECVLLPTTLTAIADVIVGSKTGLNYFGRPKPNQSVYMRKHAVGTYFNPSCAVISASSLHGLSGESLRLGLAEIVKHGVAQDSELLDQALRELAASNPDPARCYGLAKTVCELKAEILAIDPDEEGIGRVLQVGHLHAHALERAMDFEIQHTQSVYWGILMDILLSNTKDEKGSPAFDAIVKRLASSGVLPADRLLALPVDKLLESYQLDTKSFHYDGGGFSVLRIPVLGHYKYPFATEPDLAMIPLSSIRSAIEEIRRHVSVP